DTFIRYAVRILLAAVWAIFLVSITQAPYLWEFAHHTSSPQAVHVFVVVLVANIFLLTFGLVDDRISAFVNRWLFHAPDYRAETRRLADTLRSLDTEEALAAAVETAACVPLELAGARAVRVDELPALPAGIPEGEIV